jgi:hypothetical protein
VTPGGADCAANVLGGNSKAGSWSLAEWHKRWRERGDKKQSQTEPTARSARPDLSDFKVADVRLGNYSSR